MLILSPTNFGHSPVEMRTNAVASIWKRAERMSPNASAYQKIKAAYRHGGVFMTMPPFRNFWIIALPGIHTIVDWRDGWSIAMASGYGGTAKNKRIKAIVAKAVEVATMIAANEIWTCTPGLLNYHSKGLPKFLLRKLKLVPNGHQMDVVPNRFRRIDLHKPDLTAICAGKFLVYGEGRVKRAIDTLAARYPDARITIRVIGSAEDAKDGIDTYIASKRYNIELRWEQRKPYEMVIQDIADADIAIAIIRDQSYDFGTKIFDYVAAGTPILDVFDDEGFCHYFSGCFDTDYDPEKAFEKALAFRRETQVLDIKSFPSLYSEYSGIQ